MESRQKSNEYQKNYQNKKDVNTQLIDSEKMWKKELLKDYPREPLVEDHFFNVPLSNPLYWDANKEPPCCLIQKHFWE